MGEFDRPERCGCATAFCGRRLAAGDDGQPKLSAVVEAVGEFRTRIAYQDGMGGQRMRLHPSIHCSGLVSGLRQGVLHRSIGRPIAGAADDQVRLLQQLGVLARERGERAFVALRDSDHRQSCADIARQSLRLSGADCAPPKFVPTDVLPSEDIGIDKTQMFDTGLRQHPGHPGSQRAAAHDDHPGIRHLTPHPFR